MWNPFLKHRKYIKAELPLPCVEEYAGNYLTHRGEYFWISFAGSGATEISGQCEKEENDIMIEKFPQNCGKSSKQECPGNEGQEKDHYNDKNDTLGIEVAVEKLNFGINIEGKDLN